MRLRKTEQVDNVSSEALHVIGLHGSGDKISRYLQDWEVASDMLCPEFFGVARRRGWFGF